MCAKKNKQALINLVIASLISEGYILSIPDRLPEKVTVPFEKDKSYYLLNYLETNKLREFVTVEPKREQFNILLDNKLGTIVSEWYKDGVKIFNTKLAYSYLNYPAIIVCVNLFGIRKIEGIGIPTTITKKHLKTLSFSIEKILKLHVFVGNNQLNIAQVSDLFLDMIKNNFSTIDSAQMAIFLTKQDKMRLKDAISKKVGTN